ncbi:Gfo/Idh/MocA family protein [Microbacterium sp. NPDC055903]
MPAESARARTLGWAIAGTGMVSEFVASDLGLVPGARLRAVCSRDASRASEFARWSGADTSYGDWGRMLADSAVDIVYIATPHSTHARLAIEALAAGKHVLIEKPMATDAVDAARIHDAAARSGRFAMEAMWMRFNPAYRAALQASDVGELGEVRSVRASFGLPFASPDSPRWSAERASSTVLDQAVYAVTLAIDVLGRPDRVQASGRLRPDGVDLSAHMTFGYDDGRYAQLSASMIEYSEPTASINGTSGWLTLDVPFWAARSFSIRKGELGEALAGAHARSFDVAGFGYVPMLDGVQQAIGRGLTQHPWRTLDDSVASLTVLDGIRRLITETPLEKI